MNNDERSFIYDNSDKFNRVSNDSIFEYSVDFTKSYKANKKMLENNFDIFTKDSNIPDKVPGVWIIEDYYDKVKKTDIKEIYEVCCTSDIVKEMLRGVQFLFLGKRDSRKDIYKNFRNNTYTRYKYQQIYLRMKRKLKSNHNPELCFKIVNIDDSKECREKCEMSIAIHGKATFWSPNSDQLKIINRSIKG